MSPKSQTIDVEKTYSKRRSPKSSTEHLDILAHKQPHPASIVQQAEFDPRSLTPGNTVQLQRTIGNRAVDHLLDETRQSQLANTGADSTHLSRSTQRLTLNPVGDNDHYEQEADLGTQDIRSGLEVQGQNDPDDKELPINKRATRRYLTGVGDHPPVGTSNLSAAPPIIQRLLIAYTREQLGYPDAGAGFLDKTVEQIVYQRPNIANAVKVAVNGFGDGQAAGTYKHHVPHIKILNALKNDLEGKDRQVIIDTLEAIMDLLEINYAGYGVNPAQNVASFNTWVGTAFDDICDWPNNMFRFNPSSGDNGGTTLDTPGVGAPPALLNRLNEAANTLRDIFPGLGV